MQNLLISLHFFVSCVARFTTFWILGVATLCKVLLSGSSKYELFTAFATDKNTWFKPVTHKSSPSLCGWSKLHPCDLDTINNIIVNYLYQSF